MDGKRSRRTRNSLRAVLLDAYGTLFHYEPNRLASVFHDIVFHLSLPVDPHTLLERWRVHEGAFRASRVWLNERGQWNAPPPHEFTTYKRAWSRAFERASADLAISAGYAPAAVGMIVEDLTRRDTYRDVLPALEALRARVPLAIVSNADSDFLDGTLQTNGLTFDCVVNSEDARIYKPHPQIFQIALAAMGIDDPAHAIYVGDSPREDILGAQGAGIPAVWINRSGENWPDDYPDSIEYEITSLLGLVDIVASKTFSTL